MSKKSKKIYVAMSGGVDSSVAAALLTKQGYDVTGVYFKPWSPNSDVVYCNWKQDRIDAMTVAAKLGIAFTTWDVSEEYGQHVAQYMIDAYKQGITPNPDVMCNKEIKFGIFLRRALEHGADAIATGHYAQIGIAQNDYQLLRGADTNKDQSYFLWTLNQEQLKHSLFPIGAYPKTQIRTMAKKFGLVTHDKKDSQGVCFVGQLDMKSFLEEFIPSKPGDVVLLPDNKVVARHDGVQYYTLGQRHGFYAGSGGPYVIVRKDIKKDILYVTNQDAQQTVSTYQARKLHWTKQAPSIGQNVNVQTRYRQKPLKATITSLKQDLLMVTLQSPAQDAASGQSLVVYDGDQVLGGGIIV